FFAGDKTAADHSNPASTTAHTMTSASNKSQPIADFPNADLHATSGVPASKVDVHPTTKLNQGYNTHHPITATDEHPTDSIDARPTATSTTMDSRPMTEKVMAPVA
ncbi:hypothetical protein BGZ91_010182, partial [Linnemannia elongata]